MSTDFHSHYIPPFTVSSGIAQRAACGRYVHPNEHSAEPTCESCKAYVEEDAQTDECFDKLPAQFRAEAGVGSEPGQDIGATSKGMCDAENL